MDQFVKSHCRALEIPAVLDQALELKSKWDAAIAKDEKLRDVNAHHELHHAHFPDLYYAAIAYAKVNKIIDENFQISQTHTFRHTLLIDKYLRKTAAAELGELSEDTKKKLAELGYPVSRRRRHEDTESEEEDEPSSRRKKGTRVYLYKSTSIDL